MLTLDSMLILVLSDVSNYMYVDAPTETRQLLQGLAFATA